MYYIPVYGMYACHAHTDIMDASHYGACIDDYAMLLTLIYLNNLQMIALLEMVCITYQYMVCICMLYMY